MCIRTSLSLVVLGAWALGCGGSKPQIKSDAEAPSLTAADSMALEIFSLAQDTAIAPLLAQWPEPEAEPAARSVPEQETPDRETTVYRIQLFTTKDMAEATAVRDEAELDFGVQVRIDFETPYYKVRMGAFRTALEAEPHLRKAQRLGYRGAWPIRVRVPEGEG